MKPVLKNILVLGLGKVGTLVATLLHESGFTVTGVSSSKRSGHPFKTKTLDCKDKSLLQKEISHYNSVVSCLPYDLNIFVAKIAAEKSIHYFDLTEDVTTTQQIISLSKQSTAVMAPQCGLAPGFIAIIGANLADSFTKIRAIKLRVGALPKHPTGILGYAFNWSPEGVVNEYLNDCEVIENGVRKLVSPLEWRETLFIDGNKLEAFTTSGGLGTMCDTFEGKTENLDYKSIRYPGHADLMNFFFHELLMREDRQRAGEILVHAKPAVNEDLVYIHASVEGWVNNKLKREEFVRCYHPLKIAGRLWSTIAWTTAASACAVVEMVATGKLASSGFIKQEDIKLKDFLQTHNGRLYNNQPHGEKLSISW